MPELPEVETIARQLHIALAGRTLGQLLHLRMDLVRGGAEQIGNALPGSRVERVHRRAKRVIFELKSASDAQSSQLVIHLGMTGQLTVSPAAAPVLKHTHLRVAVAGSSLELRLRDPRRFGGIWFEEPSGSAVQIAERTGASRGGRPLGPLGPEPLELTLAQFTEILQRKRQIKALLLDQTAIAGLGNIYCDEALHLAGIHPLARADRLDQAQRRRLLRAVQSTLRRAIRFSGSTFMDYRSADGKPGSFQEHHRVYQREGRPCRTCGRAIRRIQAAGRSSFVCTRCQPRRTTPRPAKPSR